MTAPNNPADAAPTPPQRPPKAAPMRRRWRPDGRTRAAKRQAALRLAYVQALGVGLPYSRLPVMLRSTVDSAVALSMALDRLQAAQAAGEPAVDPDAVVRTAGALGRALEAIQGFADRHRAIDEAARHAAEDAALGLPPRRTT